MAILRLTAMSLFGASAAGQKTHTRRSTVPAADRFRPTHSEDTTERWKSLADMEAHLESAYITAMQDEFKELLTAPTERHVMVPVGE
jgi:quinol monooxygenase YgiN